jgi:hypothetical protein
MPKSRDERFRQAIDSYMTQTYTMQYNVKSLTQKKSVSMHSYDIVMPRLIKLYDVDTYHTINGVESGPGAIYSEQDLPTASEFADDFNTYFENFAFYEQCPDNSATQYNLIRLSYTETTHITNTDDAIIASVVVKYLKKYSPYPPEPSEINLEIKLNELEKRFSYQQAQTALLMRENKYFRRRITNANRDLSRVRGEYNNKLINIGNKFTSLKTIIKKLYENTTNKQEDCPVCYECITADKLVVPECGHFICSTCSVQCSRCPLCRDVEFGDYVEADSNN